MPKVGSLGFTAICNYLNGMFFLHVEMDPIHAACWFPGVFDLTRCLKIHVH